MNEAILVGTQMQLEDLRERLPYRDAVDHALVQHFHSLLDRLTPFSPVFDGLRIQENELSSSRVDVQSMSSPDPEAERAKRGDRALLRDRIDAAIRHILDARATASQQAAMTMLSIFIQS